MAAAPVASPFPALPSSSSSTTIAASTAARRCHDALLPPPAAAGREPARARGSSSSLAGAAGERRRRRGEEDGGEVEAEAERRRKEEVNRKIASRKALSVILRREATKAVLDKRKPGKGTRRLLPRTVLEALHERITALRWDSALKVLTLTTASIPS